MLPDRQGTSAGFCLPDRAHADGRFGVGCRQVAASVNAVGAGQIARTGSLNIADALQQQVPGIIVSDVSGNPFQPDIQFRGFVASPIAGTPQGLAVTRTACASTKRRRHRELGP